LREADGDRIDYRRHRSTDSDPRVSPLVVVVKGFPRVSETFIAQELAALERRGVRLTIVSLRRPYDALTHPVHGEIRARVLYLPEYLRDAPARVVRGHWRAWRRAPGRYAASLGRFLRDLLRDPTPNRGRRFGQAGVLAAELPAGARLLHAHFLHTPASVTRYAAAMVGLPYSLSAHAKDVWTSRPWELREKLRDARFSVTCTAETRDHLRRLAPEAVVELVYHGLDRRLFAPPAGTGSSRDGTDPQDPVRLLAVGRYHPKKGLDVVLEALARVSGHVALTVVGYGAEGARLRALAERLQVAGRVTWTGALDQPGVLACYRASDLFVLAPRVAPDGDRDGLPNVVVEALSQGLPVVGTRVAALHEAVEDGVNGSLVPPDDPAALAAALDALVADPARRRRYGAAALAAIAAGWDLEAGVDRLLALFEPELREAPPSARPATVGRA
jgi:glycosyltransferase involved in cell wall biosynthesis